MVGFEGCGWRGKKSRAKTNIRTEKPRQHSHKDLINIVTWSSCRDKLTNQGLDSPYTDFSPLDSIHRELMMHQHIQCEM